MNTLDEVLSSFTRVRGVDAALVVGQDGLVLHRVTTAEAEAAENDVADLVGAMVASGLVPAQEIGTQSQRGRLLQGIYEYEAGAMVLEPMGTEAILVVITSEAANLGLLRLQARKAHPHLAAALASG